MHRLLIAFLATLSLTVPAHALTYAEATITCPLDGKTFSYTAMGSGTQFGQRLDLKPIGPIDATPPLPKCPEDHFIVYEETLSDADLKTVKALVATPAYRALAKDGPTYAALARIFEAVGQPDEVIGFAWLRASWQAEGTPANGQYLHAARTRYAAVLGGELPPERRFQVGLIVGELERRTGDFSAAAKRFTELQAMQYASAEPFDRIIARQLALVGAKDRAPHPIPDAPQADK